LLQNGSLSSKLARLEAKSSKRLKEKKDGSERRRRDKVVAKMTGILSAGSQAWATPSQS
jgi:hypothetical protein